MITCWRTVDLHDDIVEAKGEYASGRVDVERRQKLVFIRIRLTFSFVRTRGHKIWCRRIVHVIVGCPIHNLGSANLDAKSRTLLGATVNVLSTPIGELCCQSMLPLSFLLKVCLHPLHIQQEGILMCEGTLRLSGLL